MLLGKPLDLIYTKTIMWLVQKGFPCGSAGKESACSAGDLCSIPGLGRSTGEGKGYPLQYSGLENSMDYIVHGVTKSRTWLSDFHLHIESVMSSYHLILCHPLLILSSIFPSIRVFSSESTLHIRWPKYWSFSFSISPSNEYSGLISFRMHWFDLLSFQGTLKSLLQHHISKASILQCSAFFMVQLSHLYMTTGKIIALTRWNFVGKVMSLLFNTLSRFVIAFLPRDKRLLISWIQSLSSVILFTDGN